ncbi:MAG: hypothetical protein U1E94_07700 [Agitococcus sp.]
MGTYSNYSITVECDETKHNPKEIIAHLRQEYEEAEFALDENGETADEAKWYDFSENMKEFSKKYPDVLFLCDVTLLGAEFMVGDDDNADLFDEDGNLSVDMCFKNGEEL